MKGLHRVQGTVITSFQLGPSGEPVAEVSQVSPGIETSARKLVQISTRLMLRVGRAADSKLRLVSSTHRQVLNANGPLFLANCVHEALSQRLSVVDPDLDLLSATS